MHYYQYALDALTHANVVIVRYRGNKVVDLVYRSPADPAGVCLSAIQISPADFNVKGGYIIDYYTAKIEERFPTTADLLDHLRAFPQRTEYYLHPGSFTNIVTYVLSQVGIRYDPAAVYTIKAESAEDLTHIVNCFAGA
jgi:hypothetical protein